MRLHAQDDRAWSARAFAGLLGGSRYGPCGCWPCIGPYARIYRHLARPGLDATTGAGSSGRLSQLCHRPGPEPQLCRKSRRHGRCFGPTRKARGRARTYRPGFATGPQQSTGPVCAGHNERRGARCSDHIALCSTSAGVTGCAFRG